MTKHSLAVLLSPFLTSPMSLRIFHGLLWSTQYNKYNCSHRSFGRLSGKLCTSNFHGVALLSQDVPLVLVANSLLSYWWWFHILLNRMCSGYFKSDTYSLGLTKKMHTCLDISVTEVHLLSASTFSTFCGITGYQANILPSKIFKKKEHITYFSTFRGNSFPLSCIIIYFCTEQTPIQWVR